MKQEKKMVNNESDALLMGLIIIGCTLVGGLTFLKLCDSHVLLISFLLMGLTTVELIALRLKFKDKMNALSGIYVLLAGVFGLFFNIILAKTYKSIGPKVEKFNFDFIKIDDYSSLFVYLTTFIIGGILYLIKNKEAFFSNKKPSNPVLEYLKSFKAQKIEEGAVLIGKNMDNNRDEFLFKENLKRHVQIVGGTGTGKTNLLKNLIEEKVKEGKSVIFIDMKADKELYDWIKRVHIKYGREESFKYLSSSNTDSSLKINPIERRDFNDIKNIIMSSIEWSEQYYRVQSEKALNTVLNYFKGIEEKYKKIICLDDILKLLIDRSFFENLEEENHFFQKDISKIDDFINNLYSKEAVKNISGLISNLENIKSSELGAHLFMDCENSGNVRAQVQDNKFLFIQLNAMKDRVTTTAMGKILLNDIINSIGDCNSNGEGFSESGCSLIIDEASDFFNEGFIDLPSKCRSSGLQLIVAHQTISDMEVVSSSFKKRLMGNMGTKIFFGTNEDEEPEMISRAIGTQKALKKTNVFNENTTEKFGSVRETDEFIFHPNVIRGLGVGEVIMIRRLHKAEAFKIKVKKASEIVLPPPQKPYELTAEQLTYKRKLIELFH